MVWGALPQPAILGDVDARMWVQLPAAEKVYRSRAHERDIAEFEVELEKK